MEDEQEACQKTKKFKKKDISTKNPKTPTGLFVSPFRRRRFEQEKEEEVQKYKRTKLEDSFEDGKNHLLQDKMIGNHNMNTTDEEYIEVCNTSSDCQQNKIDNCVKSNADIELKKLKSILKDKQETLRKLKLVKMYRKKNDLQNLQELLNKWRNVSQEGAMRLLSSITGQVQPTMSQLLNELQINHELIRYSSENETFW